MHKRTSQRLHCRKFCLRDTMVRGNDRCRTPSPPLRRDLLMLSAIVPRTVSEMSRNRAYSSMPAADIALPTLASFASTFWELSHALDSEVDRGNEICRSAARLVPKRNSTEPSATRSSSSTVGASEAFMPGMISCMRLAKPPSLPVWPSGHPAGDNRPQWIGSSLGCGGSNCATRRRLPRDPLCAAKP